MTAAQVVERVFFRAPQPEDQPFMAELEKLLPEHEESVEAVLTVLETLPEEHRLLSPQERPQLIRLFVEPAEPYQDGELISGDDPDVQTLLSMLDVARNEEEE